VIHLSAASAERPEVRLVDLENGRHRRVTRRPRVAQAEL
jgi:hypothetical protein